MSDIIYILLFFLFLNMLVDMTLALTVSTVLTFAGLTACNSSIIAFTIFFLTLASLAIASLSMPTFGQIFHFDHGLFLIDTVQMVVII